MNSSGESTTINSEATASPGMTRSVVLPVMFPAETEISHRPVLVARYSPCALKDPFSANHASEPTLERDISKPLASTKCGVIF